MRYLLVLLSILGLSLFSADSVVASGTIPAVKPIITAISPNSAKEGDVVVIEGSGFGDGTQENVAVVFGVQNLVPRDIGKILSWTDSRISVQVPLLTQPYTYPWTVFVGWGSDMDWTSSNDIEFYPQAPTVPEMVDFEVEPGEWVTEGTFITLTSTITVASYAESVEFTATLGSGLKLRNYKLTNFAGGGCYVENNLQTVICNAILVQAGAVASVQIFATAVVSEELSADLLVGRGERQYYKKVDFQYAEASNKVTVGVFQEPLLETGHFILEALVDLKDKETWTFTLTFQIPLGISVKDGCVGPCSYVLAVNPNEVGIWSYYEHFSAISGNHEIDFSWTDGESSGDQKIQVQRLFATWIPSINR